ncbi:DUF115 domain-containing protein [Sulfurimonas aquatica]|uniref:DUF115 domain-containing protein n=1 Tax=Sulfurimonas aquatica TaxID=2672570 RepID=A0A975AY58_9BACT|nr:6-hydroxymethylpterin diphosphokinase MptE-like protein [Sulfurimonas aquatica]QSZ40736.1 DUF115 domain-containing protein [Sulfurimonas aquatica]
MQDLSIEEKAIYTYNENIMFFQATQPELFNKIDSLTHAIEKKFHHERYSLEYKDDYFDVMEIKSEKYLYTLNSIKHAKVIAKSVDFTKTGNVYETFYNVTISDEFAKELEEQGIANNSYSGAASLISYSNKNADKTTHMKKLYKFIFLGTGLGLHLSEVHKKINSNVYFIVEDDLELFRLSLFVTNYKELTNNGAELVFSIFDEDTEFRKKTNIFLNKQFVYNHYIKFFHLLSHSEKKLKHLQSTIVGQTYLTFNYSALSISILRPLIHLQNGYKLLDIKSSYATSQLAKKPVLLLGAGPSFQNNIEWIQQNHKKFIVVAVSALLSKLEELNIKPDIITHVHGFSDALPHIQKIKDISFFDKTIALFGGFTEPAFLKYFKQENIYIFEGSSRYKHGHGGLTSSNIGSLSFALLLSLDSKEMYLLGLDFALDQESGQTHSNTHEYVGNIKLEEDDELGGELVYKKSVLKVKGNLREEVFTTLLMDGWKTECNMLSRNFKKENMHTYNFSDGAYIDDTIATNIDDFNTDALSTINKDKLYDSLTKTFNEKSENFLNEDEMKDLQKRLDYCNDIIEVIQKHIESNHHNLDHYHYNILGVFQELLAETPDSTTSDMDYIITMYMQFVSGYIFDLINTQEITNHKKLIKHLDRVVMPQIIRVIEYFKEIIQDYIEYQKDK